MDIRNYIRNNLSDCNEMDIRETILSSVNSNDEVVLPGLGVLFEMIWNGSNENQKKDIVKILYQDIKKPH
ncbi:small acid-soluble spore protein SspI [bacterium]|nr:small acid-soluble spore protein SspI [bacterium]